MNYRKHHDFRVAAVKHLLDDGHFPTFRSMFPFLSLKHFAKKTEIGYNRFQNLLKRQPGKFTLGEIDRMAFVLQVDPKRIIALLEAQIREQNGGKLLF
jgi:hypothetical protein